MAVNRCAASEVSAMCGRPITSAPPTMVRSTPPPSMPAAANAAVMLVEQASTAENAGTLGLSLASSQISRAILLQRSEEHTSELQSLMRISYAVFCLKKKTMYYIYLPTTSNNIYLSLF